MLFLFKKYKYLNNRDNSGFAIPQILIIGIGITIGVSGLIASSILSLTGSKINKQEFLAKSSSYSGITKIKALFNDNNPNRFFNFYWIVDNCSEKSSNCSSTKVPIPANEYWSDSKWCDGEENCRGRQKAPICYAMDQIPWINEQELVQKLFTDSNNIGTNLENSKREFNQAFNLISSRYYGTEESGINSILIEGLSLPTNSSQKSSSNKLRVNIAVASTTNESGFGFISAGENDSDKENSLFLGNLTVKPDDKAKGSIIWRMNLNSNDDCGNLKTLAMGENATIPNNENGGLWIQPLSMPQQPRLKNVEDIGTVICTPERIARNNSNCILNSKNKNEKTYRIYSIFARGLNSKFEISTRDNAKIILEIIGDIDISNGGTFCHRDGLNACGTGKAENLTILFKQKNYPKQNILVCNRENKEGGVKIKNNINYIDINYPLNNDLLPGNSFLIDNTGKAISEKFAAFIYGPQLTFISQRPNSNYVQVTNNSRKNDNFGLIVTSRGSYGYIKNTLGTSLEDTFINLILTPDLKLIPYGNNQDNNLYNYEIIGFGKKISNLPYDSQFSQSVENVFLIFDKSSSTYHLRTFNIKNINRSTTSTLQRSYPRAFAILNPKNSQNDINLGSDLDDDSIAKPWLNSFGIEMQKIDNILERNFEGAVWVKNFCLDNNGTKNWKFSKNFIENLVSWHGSEFNWGRKSYRGKSIILWDTLRKFN